MSLLPLIERHLRLNDIPATRFGREAVNDPRFVLDLRNGREPRAETCRRVMAFMAGHDRRADA